MNTSYYLKPALIGGLLTGVLSGTPLVNMGNCFCCMYVWVGSILAAYIFFKDAPFGTLGDGALVGLLSGIIAAAVNTVVSFPFMFMFWQNGSMDGRIPDEVTDALAQMPDQFARIFGMLLSPSPDLKIAAILSGFFINLPLFALIGTVGGLLGSSLFRRS